MPSGNSLTPAQRDLLRTTATRATQSAQSRGQSPTVPLVQGQQRESYGLPSTGVFVPGQPLPRQLAQSQTQQQQQQNNIAYATKKGDTLYSVARRLQEDGLYGNMPLSEISKLIAKENKIDDPNKIGVNQQIRIPIPEGQTPKRSIEGFTYNIAEQPQQPSTQQPQFDQTNAQGNINKNEGGRRNIDQTGINPNMYGDNNLTAHNRGEATQTASTLYGDNNLVAKNIGNSDQAASTITGKNDLYARGRGEGTQVAVNVEGKNELESYKQNGINQSASNYRGENDIDGRSIQGDVFQDATNVEGQNTLNGVSHDGAVTQSATNVYGNDKLTASATGDVDQRSTTYAGTSSLNGSGKNVKQLSQAQYGNIDQKGSAQDRVDQDAYVGNGNASQEVTLGDGYQYMESTQGSDNILSQKTANGDDSVMMSIQNGQDVKSSQNTGWGKDEATVYLNNSIGVNHEMKLGGGNDVGTVGILDEYSVDNTILVRGGGDNMDYRSDEYRVQLNGSGNTVQVNPMTSPFYNRNDSLYVNVSDNGYSVSPSDVSGYSHVLRDQSGNEVMIGNTVNTLSINDGDPINLRDLNQPISHGLQ